MPLTFHDNHLEPKIMKCENTLYQEFISTIFLLIDHGNEWTIMPDLKRARYGHSCVFLNDKGPFFLSILLTYSDSENK